MRWPGSSNVWGRREMHTGLKWRKLKEKHDFLKRGVRESIGFIWLMIGASEHHKKTFGFMIFGGLLDWLLMAYY